MLCCDLFPWQADVLTHIEKDFCGKPEENHVCAVAIAGANGTGKSFFGMQLMLWHFCTHPNSRNVMLTNSERQTKRTGYSVLQEKLLSLFPEKSIAISEKRSCFKTKEIDTEGVWDLMYFTQTRFESGLTGLHDANMFFFYDECIEFPEHTWKALENMWTQGRVLTYCSANPIKVNTMFHGLFAEKRPPWFCRNVSAFDLPRDKINEKLIEYKRVKYGENSANYRTSVLGKFPDEELEVLFPHSFLLTAMRRESSVISDEKSVLGVDVAEGRGFGSSCAYAMRAGYEFVAVDAIDCSYEQFRDIIFDLVRRHVPAIITVDATGVGFGLYSDLRRSLGSQVIPVKATERACDYYRFQNRRVELLYRFAEWFRHPQAVMPFDDDLLKTLPKLELCTDKEKISMDSKKDFKKDKTINQGTLDKIDCMSYTFATDSAIVNRVPTQRASNGASTFRQFVFK